MRRLEAVRDSNRRKTLRDAMAWLRQAARNPHEANMHRSEPMHADTHTHTDTAFCLLHCLACADVIEHVYFVDPIVFMMTRMQLSF